MKIYIVTKGSYSDYHICGVAVDLKEAERLQNINTDEWDMARIETYDTEDNGEIEGWFKHHYVHRYVFKFNTDKRYKNHKNAYDYVTIYDGECHKDDWLMAKRDEREGRIQTAYGIYHYVCVESNKPFSVVEKIAYDRYAEWKATQEGLS